jgi:hypothetical protein
LAMRRADRPDSAKSENVRWFVHSITVSLWRRERFENERPILLIQEVLKIYYIIGICQN